MTDSSKFDELTSDVDWQLKSLLSYIRKGFKASLKARAKMSPSELVVQDVLEAYLMLAEKFYGQFRSQLGKAYHQKENKNTAGDHISDADVSILMQQALDKLTAEWERVYGFMAATQAKKTSETQQVITKLSPLVRAAISDVGFSPESFPVIPQFGTIYGLGFFNYTDDFMALNLPITALESPWEWTIFWHEIAGQKLRLLKKTQRDFLNVLGEMFGEMRRWQQQNLIDQKNLWPTIRANVDEVLRLTVPFAELNALEMERKSDFLDFLTERVFQDWNSPDASNSSFTATREFIHDLSPERRKFPILMFSFNDLLDEVMDKLRSQQKDSARNDLRDAHKASLKVNRNSDTETDNVLNNLLKAWEKALNLEDTLAAQKKALADEGWSADWLEELFEDSFSALNFDINFLPVFDRLLQRRSDGGKDMRHPPHHIRLATAAALKLLDCDEAFLQQVLPPQVNEFPIALDGGEKEILSKYYPDPLSDNAKAVVWLVAKRFHEMHKRMRIPYDDPGGAIQKAKDTIANAMKTHKDNLNKAEEIAKLANSVLTSLAGSVSDSKPSPDDTSTAYNKFNLAKQNYAKKIYTLLHTRNVIPPQLPLGYHELLDLSFYDVDFLATTITDVVVNSESKSWKITWIKVLSDEVKRGGTGPISYKVDGAPHRTTSANWNVDFGNTEYKV